MDEQLRGNRIRGGSRMMVGHRLRGAGGGEGYLFLWPLLWGINSSGLKSVFRN